MLQYTNDIVLLKSLQYRKGSRMSQVTGNWLSVRASEHICIKIHIYIYICMFLKLFLCPKTTVKNSFIYLVTLVYFHS